MATKLSAAQRDVLVRTILGEARGEGVSGMEAVAHNIMNRANSGRFPSDPAAVALQPYQYSTWNRGEGGNNPQQFRPGTRAYNEAADVIDRVFSGQTADPTNGALYYHTPEVNPAWSGEVNRYGTTQLGNHIFYNGYPTPPANIPNTVASRLDVARGPVPASMPTPVPPMLNAQRNLQPLNTNVSDVYRGIYQPARLTAPGAVNQSVQGAQSGQNSQLAQSLQNYANRQTRSTPPMSSAPVSYAGQDRAPPSNNRRLTDAELARIPVNQGTFVPTQTRLPPIRQAPVAQMTRSEQRADNGQVRQPARPAAPPVRAPVAPPANMVAQSMQRAQTAANPALQASVDRMAAQRAMAGVPVNSGSRDSVANNVAGQALARNLPTRPTMPGPAAPPKAQDRLAANVYPANPATRPVPAIVPPIQVGLPAQAASVPPIPRPRPVIAPQVAAVAPPVIAPVVPPVLAPVVQPQQPARSNPLRIVVQRDPAFAGTSTGTMYQPGQVYTQGRDRLLANANGTFTNLRNNRVLPGSSGLARDMDISGRSRRDPLSPSQSLSGNW